MNRLLAILGAALLLVGGVLAYVYLQPTPPAGPDLARDAREDLERRNYRPLSEPLDAILKDTAYQPVPTQADPLLNRPAPEFTLIDVDGMEWSLATKRTEGPIVLVFYYGYHCNHCVSQLFALDQDLARFRELGAQVVAISADPADVTRQRYQKYGAFHFPVLSDPGFKVSEKYGTFAPSKVAGEDGNQLHGTFLIDRRGHVVWANRGDQPFTENRTLLREIHRRDSRP